MLIQQPSSLSSRSSVEPERISRDFRTRRAALLIGCDPVSQHCIEELATLSTGRWKRLLRWLHLSGLALSFFDRMFELRLVDMLPPWAVAQLQQNLEENRERMQGMLAESIAIQHEFQRESLSYAVLKGASLWPCSVGKPELRLQFDVDFLVAEESIADARHVLEARGYRLYEACVTRGHYRFKRNEKPGLTLKHVYRNTGSWIVELHGAAAGGARRPLLDRLHWREIGGFRMPVLAPADLFLGQAMHAFKDVCGPFPRASALMEFRRHVMFRRNDEAFWKELYARVDEDPAAQIALGIVTQLIMGVTGDFAPEAFTRRTVDRVPPLAQLWCRQYGARVALGSHPGNKLFLLLRQALGNPVDSTGEDRPLRQVLLPLRLPPPPVRAFPAEKLSIRLSRYRMHIALILERVRFHVVEGLRFWWELRRWRQLTGSPQE